jgi:hypothetical protein
MASLKDTACLGHFGVQCVLYNFVRDTICDNFSVLYALALQGFQESIEMGNYMEYI